MTYRNLKGVPDFDCFEYADRSSKYCLCIPIINEKENITLELHRARINKVHTMCDIIICDGGNTDGGNGRRAEHGIRETDDIGFRIVMVCQIAGDLLNLNIIQTVTV